MERKTLSSKRISWMSKKEGDKWVEAPYYLEEDVRGWIEELKDEIELKLENLNDEKGFSLVPFEKRLEVIQVIDKLAGEDLV